MNKIFSLFVGILIYVVSAGQPVAEKPKILYGTCTKDSLTKAPFDKWFTTGYEKYTPNAATVAQLKKQNLKNISIEVFFGTWCGDSRREVPRLMKLLDQISFKNVHLMAVGGSDSLFKQTPLHDERNKGIFHVPAIIVYKDGIELNRINEYPSLSLEKDLLDIISNLPVIPNYHSFALINKWLNDGSLVDENISSRGLAMQIKTLTANENELNSLGYLLLVQDKKKEALKIFQVNNYLYPESANVISSLGEGYLRNGDSTNAILYLEKSLQQNKDPNAVKDILDILYEAKGLKKDALKPLNAS
jgi:tetratricopeptide (TPR) repeat protein